MAWASRSLLSEEGVTASAATQSGRTPLTRPAPKGKGGASTQPAALAPRPIPPRRQAVERMTRGSSWTECGEGAQTPPCAAHHPSDDALRNHLVRGWRARVWRAPPARYRPALSCQSARRHGGMPQEGDDGSGNSGGNGGAGPPSAGAWGRGRREGAAFFLRPALFAARPTGPLTPRSPLLSSLPSVPVLFLVCLPSSSHLS